MRIHRPNAASRTDRARLALRRSAITHHIRLGSCQTMLRRGRVRLWYNTPLAFLFIPQRCFLLYWAFVPCCGVHYCTQVQLKVSNRHVVLLATLLQRVTDRRGGIYCLSPTISASYAKPNGYFKLYKDGKLSYTMRVCPCQRLRAQWKSEDDRNLPRNCAQRAKKT